MASYKEKIDLRKQGLTHKEIAEKLGISRQIVSQTLATYDPSRFRYFEESACIGLGCAQDWSSR